MSHGPSSDWGKDNASGIKSKLGLWMFAIYSLVYAGFIMINIIKPKLMGTDVGTLNLAIVYGFGLILFALLLAAIYNYVCNKSEQKLNNESGGEDNEI